MSFVYSALAFVEVLVLFASAISVLVLVVRQAVREINRLLDAAFDAASPSTESSVKNPEPVSATAGSRTRKVVGGHNEQF
jgi:hypothetical protein